MGIGASIDRWSRRSQEGAVRNARAAATDLSRSRVEREEIELYVQRHVETRRAVSDAVRPA